MVNTISPYSLTSPTISVESFLDKLGGYSRFQIWVTIVLISPELTSAMIAMSPILTGTMNALFRCENSSDGSSLIVPASDICSTSCNGTWKAFETHISIVQEWNLTCSNAWVVDMLTSIQMFGSMAGALLSSQFADRYGRRKAFFTLCLVMGIFGFLSGLAFDPVSFAGTRFMAGFAVGGLFVVYVNYLMEFLTPSTRTICGCVSLWAFGEMLLAVLGYLLRGWRLLTYATSLPILGIFIAFPFLPESPRWLLCNNRTEEAIQVFAQIAKWNGKMPIDTKEIHVLQKKIICETNHETRTFLQQLSVLKNVRLRIQLLLLMFMWFSMSLVYYGVSFNLKNLSGDPYLNLLYMGIIDAPGCYSALVFNNRFGRRRTFLAFNLVGGIFLMAIVLIEANNWLVAYPLILKVLSFLSRFCNAASFAVMSCFTAESFPTRARVSCMGICALSGNIGSVISPQLAFLGTFQKWAHYLVFCVLTLLSATGAFFLHDMNGKPLQDSVNENDNHSNHCDKKQQKITVFE